jgi:hypothetical protein
VPGFEQIEQQVGPSKFYPQLIHSHLTAVWSQRKVSRDLRFCPSPRFFFVNFFVLLSRP